MVAKNVKCIILDYNSTLADDFSYHVEAYAQTFSEFGINIDRSVLYAGRGLSTSEKIEEVLRIHESNIPVDSILRRKIELYNIMVTGKYILYPEAEESLRRLYERYEMALYTGSARAQLNGALPEDLSMLFRLIISQEDAVKPKPAPDTLLMMAKRLNFVPSECAYIGDVRNDMLAAKNAGMYAVGITHQFNSESELKEGGADIIFPDLKLMADFFLHK